MANSMRCRFLGLLALAIAFGPLSPPAVQAHQGHKHGQDASPAPEAKAAPVWSRAASEYAAKVKPIFDHKCADCHGRAEALPWYHSVPGVRQLMDSDISEAREHLAIEHGFPFEGHGTVEEDLRAIVETVNEGSMPPWYYRIFHRGSALTEDEKRAVRAWATDALATPHQ